MKFIILAVLVATAVAATYEVYPTKYDNLDIDAILHNKRLFNNYLQCLLKKGKCNDEGAILRDVIPDALITGCRKCNDHQKVSVEKVIRFLIKERNSDWQELISVYDPKGEYQAQYAHYLEKI
ncbi:ejaculatory bulb-specific protein 3-like [Tribolium madens]|uniref:ejaculatory bulb-specific protein 3-like n=1 Tax=Tribolium madens TaxID=41895 RepID=UPI001CF722F7|nr:ejaculatory bulb-specific protein 3-like [Tribolium madens]